MGGAGGATHASASSYDTNVRIAMNIFIWYASSVICTNSSKRVTPYISPLHLTLLQLCFASLTSYILLTVVNIEPFSRPHHLLPSFTTTRYSANARVFSYTTYSRCSSEPPRPFTSPNTEW